MMSKLAGLKKTLLFGLLGAAGCFVGAILGEILLAFALPSPEPSPPPPPPAGQVDLLFVLDVTGSMEQEIRGVQRGIQDFVSQFSSRNVDARVGLIAFRDRLAGEEPQVLSFSGQVFTADAASFSYEVGKLRAYGGGDDPESSFDAAVLAARSPFRSNATKIIILITDAPPKIPDRETPSIEAAAQVLRDHKINQLHLVVQDSDRAAFGRLQSETPGEVFSLAETAAGRQAFDRLLSEMGERIASTVRTGSPVQSQVAVSPRHFWSLVIATSLWTGMLAIGVSLALISGQNRYLYRPLLTLRQGVGGTVGSLLAGFVSGTAGQLLYGGAAIVSALQVIGRIVAWTILGGLLGRGMAFFVPNLKPDRALLGGAFGGAVGAIGFLWAAGVVGDMTGRFVGAAILGFFIGLMLILIEVAFRKAWLEISYGPKETRTVSLGLEPVSIGSDRNVCIIYARNASPVAFRYKLDQGRILCEDVVLGHTASVVPGAHKIIGNVTVSVRAAGTTTPIAPAAPVSLRQVSNLSLRLSSGRTIRLTEGRRLSTTDIPGLEASAVDGTVAEINRNPSDPTILGLKNLSRWPWSVTTSGGDRRQLEPGRSIRLAVGTKINFGLVTGGIVDE